MSTILAALVPLEGGNHNVESTTVVRLPIPPTQCNFCDGPMGRLECDPAQPRHFKQSCTLCAEVVHVFTSPTAPDVSVSEKHAKEKKKTVNELARDRMGTRADEYPAAAAPGS